MALQDSSFYFHDALLKLRYLSAHKNGVERGVRNSYLKSVRRSLKKLRKWAKFAPANCSPKISLLQAETARLRGDVETATAKYSEAAAGARDGLFLHEEALAHELAGAFYLENGHTVPGEAHIRRAAELYGECKASAELAGLEERYPETVSSRRFSEKRENRSSQETESCQSSASKMDVLIRTAEWLSEELPVKQPVARLIEVLSEASGAQQVLLYIGNEQDLSLAAAACTHRENEGRPEALVYYVGRTRQTVTAESVDWSDLVDACGYLRRIKPRSAICVPLISCEDLIGVVYLENRMTQGAFSDVDVDVLRLVAFQVAVALENAALREALHHQDATVESEESIRVSALEISERNRLVTLDESAADDLSEALDKLMVEKRIYRDNTLSLESLAAATGYPARSVSEVINIRFEKNFYRFVGDHRIEEVKRRLADPDECDSVLRISLDAGFSSKSSFNAFFKEYTGMTPSAFRKQNLQRR